MYNDEDIRQLILDIQSKSDYIRERALSELHSTSDSRFVSIALAMLDEEDYESVRTAINSLRNLRNFNPPQFLPRVCQFLDVPSHCASALWFIWCVGDASYIPRLLPFLTNPDSKVRYQALKTVSRHGYSNLLEIALYMCNDPDAKIRAFACSILGKFQDPRIVDILISKLTDFEENGFYPVASVAADKLGERGDKRAVKPLMNTLVNGDKTSAMSALNALWKIEGVQIIDFLLEQIGHPHDEIRYEIIRYLSQHPRTGFTEIMISILGTEKNPNVKRQAAYTLLNIGTSKARNAANQWLEQHS